MEYGSKSIRKSFGKGVAAGVASEVLSGVSRHIQNKRFQAKPKSVQKSILTNRVFKKGNYYSHWTWKTYRGSSNYKKYIDRFSNAIGFVVGEGSSIIK